LIVCAVGLREVERVLLEAVLLPLVVLLEPVVFDPLPAVDFPAVAVFPAVPVLLLLAGFGVCSV
jgi:hypothetical protein